MRGGEAYGPPASLKTQKKPGRLALPLTDAPDALVVRGTGLAVDRGVTSRNGRNLGRQTPLEGPQPPANCSPDVS